MEQASLAARAVLAGVLAAAAIAKALDLRASGRAAAALGVPERLASAAGVAVPALEVTAAVMLLVPDAVPALAATVVAQSVLVGPLVRDGRPASPRADQSVERRTLAGLWGLRGRRPPARQLRRRGRRQRQASR